MGRKQTGTTPGMLLGSWGAHSHVDCNVPRTEANLLHCPGRALEVINKARAPVTSNLELANSHCGASIFFSPSVTPISPSPSIHPTRATLASAHTQRAHPATSRFSSRFIGGVAIPVGHWHASSIVAHHYAVPTPTPVARCTTTAPTDPSRIRELGSLPTTRYPAPFTRSRMARRASKAAEEVVEDVEEVEDEEEEEYEVETILKHRREKVSCGA